MTLRSVDHALVAPVCAAIADWMAPLPIKRIARDLGASLPTASRIKRGELPSLPVLLAAFRRYGTPFAAKVLGAVLDGREFFDTAATLSRLDDTLSEARHDLARLQEIVAAAGAVQAVADGARVLRPLQADAGDRQAAGGAAAEVEAAGPAGPAGVRRPRAPAAAFEQAPALAAPAPLACVFQPLDAAAGDEVLRRLLLMPGAAPLDGRWGRVELDDAIAFAKADASGATGVAYRAAGDPWRFGWVGDVNPVHPDPRAMEGKPVAAMSDPAYGADLCRQFDRQADTGVPMLMDHAGAILRGGRLTALAGRIGRIVCRARSGMPILMARFRELPLGGDAGGGIGQGAPA